MDIVTNETILYSFVAVVTAFLFGQSGVLHKVVDFIFTSKTKRAEREATELEAKEQEIHHLREEVQELKKVISKLDKDLVETTIYMKALLSYLRKFLPEGTTDEFIEEMRNEITRKTHE